MLKIFNTPARQTADFTPQRDDVVTVYTCGPTVYNEPHVGNWVAYIRWDILVRTLQALGYRVDRVLNITDVGHLVSDGDDGEDKMERGARREGKTAWEIAAQYTDSFIAGMNTLHLLPPQHIAKATDYIAEQITMVEQLERAGYTYVISDGVYFDTSKFPDYADFAHLDLAAQQAGARVELNTEKKNPSDFALWKFSPSGAQRDMEWQSPWGKGFPGWHLECSAIIRTLLGDTIDIHTGGIDHIPVHHTNEIAQSQSLTTAPLAHYWMHANFITVDGTKISKSLDNGFTLDDITARGLTPLDFKLFILQSHYRSETNFTWENIEAAHNRLSRWKSIAELRHQMHDTLRPDTHKKLALRATKRAILERLSDDLDTPGALVLIDEAFARVEQHDIDDIHHPAFVELLTCIDDVLGLDLLGTTPDINDNAKQLIIARERAREQRDWARSDELRDELQSLGISVRDTPHGTIWSRQ